MAFRVEQNAYRPGSCKFETVEVHVDYKVDCRKVLVVEDDLAIRESLEQILEFEGYCPILAENGERAFEILKTGERPCVILLDLMMPVMSGWEFLEVQKESAKLSEIPVVIVSAAGEKARLTTANDFLRKPIDVDRLLELVSHYCPSAA
jgi:CheY-like chemotaxis protein